MTYKEFCILKTEENNIFPKGTNIEEFIGILVEHLLGKNWYVNYPILNREQLLTEILGEILLNYKSWEYKKLPWYKKLKEMFVDV